MKNLKRAILIILTAIILIMAFCSCDDQTDSEVILYLNGARVFVCNEECIVLNEIEINDTTECSLKLVNNTEKAVSIRLYSENGSAELSTESGENQTSSTELNGKICGIVFNGKGYVISEKGLTSISSDGYDCVLLNDITTEQLTINSPVSILTGEYSLTVEDFIMLKSNKYGDYYLEGNISAAKLVASAPNCIIFVPENLIPDNPDLYIDAMSVNGKDLMDGFVIKSIDELHYLLNESYFQYIIDDEVKLLDFDLYEDITFTVPVTLICENLGGTGKISFDTESEGDIKVKGLDGERLSINAPNCNLVGSGLTVFEVLNKYIVKSIDGYNISSYYNYDSTEIKISMKYSDYSWKFDGTKLVVSVSDIIVPSEWKNASPSITVSNGWSWIVPDWCRSSQGINLLSDYGTGLILKKGDSVKLIEIVTDFSNLLPIVEINTEDSQPIESKEDWIKATISIDNTMCTGYDFEDLENLSCEIAGRGNSTWDWSFKKPYKIKLDKKASVLGMAESKNWVLLSNYLDKSLIRNYVALECAKLLDNCDSYATQFPVNVYLNGEYIGVYTMGEKVEEGEGRAYIKEKAYSVDTGFILELNSNDASNDDCTFRVSGLGPVTVHYPSLKTLTEKQLTYISNFMNLTTDAIYKGRDWQQYIDIDSFIDWYIMIEFSYNSDSCFRRSVFFEKSTDGKLGMGQPWDFDLAFGNSRGDGDYNMWAALVNNNYVGVNWMTYLMKNEEFYSALKNRWNEVKDELLETALSSVDEGYRLVKPSSESNFKVWDILYKQLSMEPWYVYENKTYDDQVNYLKSFIQTRWDWIDSTLNEES